MYVRCFSVPSLSVIAFLSLIPMHYPCQLLLLYFVNIVCLCCALQCHRALYSVVWAVSIHYNQSCIVKSSRVLQFYPTKFMCLPTRTPILMVVVIRVVFVLQNLAKMRFCSLVLSSNFSNCCRDQFVDRTIGEEFKFLELQSSFRSAVQFEGGNMLCSAAATCRDAGLEMMSDWCSLVALGITVYGPEVNIGLD